MQEQTEVSIIKYKTLYLALLAVVFLSFSLIFIELMDFTNRVEFITFTIALYAAYVFILSLLGINYIYRENFKLFEDFYENSIYERIFLNNIVQQNRF